MFCPRCGTAIDAADRFCRACGAATGFGGASPATRTGSSRGRNIAKIAFLAVGGLVLVLVISGIVAAIAVPNLLAAAERGRQRHTIADMRTVAAAVEAYAADHLAYPDAGTVEDLAALLEPEYVQGLPRTDGWGRPLKYESWLETEEDEAPTLYALGSAGKDGAWERQDLIDTPEGRTRGFNADIVLVNGTFVQFPEGVDPEGSAMRTDTPPPSPGAPSPSDSSRRT